MTISLKTMAFNITVCISTYNSDTFMLFLSQTSFEIRVIGSTVGVCGIAVLLFIEMMRYKGN